MNFIANESPTKLRGGYYTDPDLARFLVRWAVNGDSPTVLEPSCGDGIFIEALGAREGAGRALVVAFDTDVAELKKTGVVVSALPGLSCDLRNEDFLGWALEKLPSGPVFDAIVGNPPFIRYQYLDESLQLRAANLAKYFGIPFTKHTNAWVPFVIASVGLLHPHGRLGMVVPSEILHVLHAQSLRSFLAERCSRITLIDPAELWFENALQGAVLLLAERRRDESECRLSIVRTRGRDFLGQSAEDIAPLTATRVVSATSRKWMEALLEPDERDCLEALAEHADVVAFKQVADADVGIVTGANKFFLVTDEVVDEFDLHRWARPMFGRSEHVPGVIYDEAVHAKNKARGLPTNFLWFAANDRLNAGAKRYIARGESQELHTRYKCRIRDPWYSVPSVYSTEVGMLKRSHDAPRLVANRLEAFSTDTAYRIKAKSVKPEQLVWNFSTSLTALSAELNGRHYGGGVLELVPSEIERLLVPHLSSSPGLAELERLYRDEVPIHQLLEQQDRAVLGRIGVSAHQQRIIRRAWTRLRSRRRREVQAVRS